jgi:hypothetical protein
MPFNLPFNLSSNLSSIDPSDLLPSSDPFGSINSIVPSQVPSQMSSQLPSQLPSQVPSQMSSQLPSQLPFQIPSQLQSELSSQLPSELSSQLKDSKNNSIILNLESLIMQYDTLLIQYNQVQSDYINYLQKNSSLIQSQKNSDLTTIKKSTFWGADGILSSHVPNVEDCSALCVATLGCSGATYNVTNTNQHNCWIRTGDGMVITGTNEQYAIIPKIKNYLLTLQSINTQLIDVNNKIIIIFKTNENNFSFQDKERTEKYNLLKENYRKLEEEHLKISNKLIDDQTIEGKKNQTELIVTKNYYNYLVLLFIVLLCFLILSKTIINSMNENVPSPNNNFGSVILMVVFSLIIILAISYFYKSFR